MDKKTQQAIYILGVPVDCVYFDKALVIIDTMVYRAQPETGIADNPEKVINVQEGSCLTKRLRDSGAQILFIGLGRHRQENWIETNLPNLNVSVCQGVGGSYDVLIGHVRRALKLLRHLNLEWFYRLLINQCRLMRQINCVAIIYLPGIAAGACSVDPLKE